jgi:hypothetical protein
MNPFAALPNLVSLIPFIWLLRLDKKQKQPSYKPSVAEPHHFSADPAPGRKFMLRRGSGSGSFFLWLIKCLNKTIIHFDMAQASAPGRERMRLRFRKTV